MGKTYVNLFKLYYQNKNGCSFEVLINKFRNNHAGV